MSATSNAVNMSMDSLLNTLHKLWNGRPEFRGSVPGTFLSSPQHPHCVILSGYRETFPRSSATGPLTDRSPLFSVSDYVELP